MLKIEIAEFLAEGHVIEGGAWGVKTWTNHFMKFNKVELEMLLDSATDPDRNRARKTYQAANDAYSTRTYARDHARMGGRI